MADAVREVQVASYPTQLEAELWADLLRNAGIPAYVQPIGAGSQPWTDQLWPHAIHVRATDAARAHDILTSPHDAAADE